MINDTGVPWRFGISKRFNVGRRIEQLPDIPIVFRIDVPWTDTCMRRYSVSDDGHLTIERQRVMRNHYVEKHLSRVASVYVRRRFPEEYFPQTAFRDG